MFYNVLVSSWLASLSFVKADYMTITAVAWYHLLHETWTCSMALQMNAWNWSMTKSYAKSHKLYVLYHIDLNRSILAAQNLVTSNTLFVLACNLVSSFQLIMARRSKTAPWRRLDSRSSLKEVMGCNDKTSRLSSSIVCAGQAWWATKWRVHIEQLVDFIQAHFHFCRMPSLMRPGVSCG